MTKDKNQCTYATSSGFLEGVLITLHKYMFYGEGGCYYSGVILVRRVSSSLPLRVVHRILCQESVVPNRSRWPVTFTLRAAKAVLIL